MQHHNIKHLLEESAGIPMDLDTQDPVHGRHRSQCYCQLSIHPCILEYTVAAITILQYRHGSAINIFRSFFIFSFSIFHFPRCWILNIPTSHLLSSMLQYCNTGSPKLSAIVGHFRPVGGQQRLPPNFPFSSKKFPAPSRVPKRLSR